MNHLSKVLNKYFLITLLLLLLVDILSFYLLDKYCDAVHPDCFNNYVLDLIPIISIRSFFIISSWILAVATVIYLILFWQFNLLQSHYQNFAVSSGSTTSAARISSPVKYLLLGFFESLVLGAIILVFWYFAAAAVSDLMRLTLAIILATLPSIFFSVRLKFFAKELLSTGTIIALYVGIFAATALIVYIGMGIALFAGGPWH